MATPRERGATPPVRLVLVGLGLLAALTPASSLASPLAHKAIGHKSNPSWEQTLLGWGREGEDWLQTQGDRLTGLIGHSVGSIPEPASASPVQPDVEPVLSATGPVQGTGGAGPRATDELLEDSTNLKHSVGLGDAIEATRIDRFHPTRGPISAEDDGLTGPHVAAQRISSAGLDTPAHHSHGGGHGHGHGRGGRGSQGAIPRTTPMLDPAFRAAHSSPQTVVPEPGTATIALALIGSFALARRVRRRRSTP